MRNDLQVVSPDSRKSVGLGDDEIARQVENRLAADGRLKSVHVRTDAGVVTLTGDAPTIGAGADASEMARERTVCQERAHPRARRQPAWRIECPEADAGDGDAASAQGQGYDPGPIDGVMGRKTASALKKYQQTEHLNVTGQMDAETVAKLEAQNRVEPRRPAM